MSSIWIYIPCSACYNPIPSSESLCLQNSAAFYWIDITVQKDKAWIYFPGGHCLKTTTTPLCFCRLPLKLGGIFHISKHKNNRAICLISPKDNNTLVRRYIPYRPSYINPTYYPLVTRHRNEALDKNGLDNGLLLGSTKALPETRFTRAYWHPSQCNFTANAQDMLKRISSTVIISGFIGICQETMSWKRIAYMMWFPNICFT